MQKKLLIAITLFITIANYAQTQASVDTLIIDEPIYLKGTIISNTTKEPLVGAHVFNLNSVYGSISNDEGKFSILTQPKDTLYFSYLGYQSIKLKVTKDLLKGNELVVELIEKREEMKEVVVRSHKLIGVLEIDAKNVPTNKYARIYISGLKQTYEIGATKRSTTINSPLAALFKPIDAVYNMFGKKPKQLRKLKKLRDDDNLRNLLEAKFDRELMMEYLDMSSEELNDLLNECNYSDYFIKQASDLQLIEAVLLCYENYKAIKKGSTKRE
ncbi:MAG TPA: carboxypeptidase-like regulatory domain-containing protein [Flavobacteriaceae bacterium]|nr:carboxypeptidase-like regulatory domain-containing protein [Flavobacteriaceae bacterium]